MNELGKRILTAVVGGSAFLGVLIYGGGNGALLISFVMAIAMWEEFLILTHVVRRQDRVYRLFQSIRFLGVGFVYGIWAFAPEFFLDFSVLLFLILFIFYLFACSPKFSSELDILNRVQELVFTLF